MITFSNELERAHSVILTWSDKSILKSVTIVRDVFGKLSFLFNVDSCPNDIIKESLENILRISLENYAGKFFWVWENMSEKKIRYLRPIYEMMMEGRVEWAVDQGIKFYLSERPIAKKAWISRQVNESNPWSYEDALHGIKPKVITFYSFKGGMGRTTTLASVAINLVKKGKNVMMIDTDIEAPGLATLFFAEESIRNGVLDYLLEHSLSSGVNVADYVLDVTDPSLLRESDGKLYLMPAGKVDGNYIQKLARIDYQDHREGALRKSMCDMLEAVSSAYAVDYILIDSRAGFHDMGGIAVTQLPHGVVLFGNNSRQSWDGLAQVIRTISESHADNLPIVIADCMCEHTTSATFVQTKESFLQKSYTVCMENYYMEGEALPGREAVNVPHAPVFLPYDMSLQQEITLYSTGSAEADMRVQAFTQRLMTDIYKVVVDRIEAWFGEGDAV